jgi:broad specificity phosphatase PhoE
MKRSLISILLLGLFISGAVAQPTIFIVRHAEKTTSGGDDPQLSDAGRTHAKSLAKMLKDAGITMICATEFKRTRETAAPLAKVLGITVSTLPSKNTAALVSTLRQRKANALVVGHTNTIPDLIKALGIDAPINIAESEYDNLFVVILSGKTRLIRLHYFSIKSPSST